MKTPSAAYAVSGLLALGTLLPGAAGAAPLSLSEAPLTVSTSVQPNVMLLMDNSGSMDNIIWADGYDSQVAYAVWQYKSGSSWSTLSTSAGNIYHSSLGKGGCSLGYQEFRKKSNTSLTKCLKIPDPVGGRDTRFSANYINYLLQTYSDGTDLTTGLIPNEYRMKVARDVASSLVATTSGMRFGVSRFYGPSSYSYGHGAQVDAACGSSVSTIQAAIAGYTAETNTPLAEALYEVTRYFRGLSSYYHSNVNYTSPIQYRCQKNFTIVVTDGLPTYDATIPTNDPDDAADSSHALPDWDGEHPATTQAMYPNFPQYSDGFAPTNEAAGEGASLFLDDIAKFAWDIDFKKSGSDAAGGSYQDPKFLQQNMYTYTVGFSTANQMLEDAAEYGHGQYYTASSASQLSAALRSALADILAKSGSSSSAAANAGFIGAGTKIYQARFNSGDWTGQLLAFAIDNDRTSATYGRPLTSGSGPGGSLWDAGSTTKLPAWSSRNIFTIKDGDGIPFRWSSLSTAVLPSTEGDQQGMLDNDERILKYLRGDGSLELDQNGGIYRNRASKLGDIVDSAPVFVGAPGFRYPADLESTAYSTFATANENRTKMIYVGANDGMLHGFDANNGVEKMAYIPSPVFGRLKALTSKDYNHRYYVDGSPTAIDAFVGGSWKTVLAGGLNKGGQGIYALDVTDPSSFGESAGNATKLVLWEFTDRNDADLGYTYSQPAIVRLHNGKWAAIFGNGYNNTEADGRASTTGNAVLYVVDLETGAVIRKLDTGIGTAQDPKGSGRPNGLGTVAVVDVEGDYKADYVYAGDFFGNMWKFDLKDAASSSWKIGFSGQPLFTACGGSTCTTGANSNRQPITSRPEVGRHPSGAGVVVYFGTGKYLETGDNNGALGGKQTYYAIGDSLEASETTVSGRSLLVQQSIVQESNVSGSSYRVTSKNDVNWSAKRGWFLDLVPPSGTGEGERQVTNSLLRNGKIIFTTVIPANDPCVPGGPSWLMELDARSGSRLAYTPFDVNHDGKFTDEDFIAYGSDTTPASGTKTEGGAATTPSVMAGEGGQERKYISNSEGLETITENPGPYDTGRQSWRQLGL